VWNHSLRYLFSLPITVLKRRAYLTTQLSTPLGRAFPAARSNYPPVSLLLSNAGWQYRNINLLSIDYACRPRLRSRLTLGGRPFPRKPWIFDGEDSHFTLVTYSDILTTDQSARPHGRASLCYSKLPYQPINEFRSFGTWFSPGDLRRRLTRLVSYYALFE
jgi:hypothetical protein